jgi:hypothetical protein
MTKEYDAEIYITHSHSPWGDRVRYVGKVYNDTLTTGYHPFKDGEVATISEARSIVGTIMTTLSGTRYKLLAEDPSVKND